MRIRYLLPFLAFAACGTPQENCIRQVTRDLRVVDTLIAETEANIARGYAIETQEITRHRWEMCDVYPRRAPKPGTEPAPPPPPRMCLEPYTDTISRNVAIDLEAEKRKLASLRTKRAELSRSAAPGIAECRARYPES